MGRYNRFRKPDYKILLDFIQNQVRLTELYNNF